MKKIILSAAIAAFAFSAVPAFAGDLPVKIVKTKLPDGCEYKKVAGHKKKQIVCLNDAFGTGGSSDEVASNTCVGGNCDPAVYNGKSGNLKGANNGKGNGTNDPAPGHSADKGPLKP